MNSNTVIPALATIVAVAAAGVGFGEGVGIGAELAPVVLS